MEMSANDPRATHRAVSKLTGRVLAYGASQRECVALCNGDKVPRNQYIVQRFRTSPADVRSQCARVRLSYRPEWDTGRPWVAYENGTACGHFATLDDAKAVFTARGFKF